MASLVGSNTKFGLDLSPNLVNFIAGFVGGIAAILVGQPLDTVKTRLQTPVIGQKYRSTFHALITIAKQEKVMGLYKGVAAPLASCALLNGLIFASYGWFLDLQLDDPQKSPTLWQVVLAGIATGIVTSVLTAPVELVKIRQQNELTTNPSVKAVTSQLYRQHGIRGLYRGITTTMLRDTSYGAYFGSYEACCQLFTPVISDHPALTPSPGPTVWGLLLAGGIAGIVGWSVTFPIDVVKTRVQNTDWTPYIPLDAESTRLVPSSLSQASPGNPYRTTLSTIIYSYRQEGIFVFYRGLSTTLMRAIPVNIVIFAAYNFTARVLS